MKKNIYLIIIAVIMMISSCGNNTMNNSIIESTSNCIDETEKTNNHVVYIKDSGYNDGTTSMTMIEFKNNGTCWVGDLNIDIDTSYKDIEKGFCTYEYTDDYVIVSFDEGEGKIFFDIDDEGMIIYNQEKSVRNKRIDILFKNDKYRMSALVDGETLDKKFKKTVDN